MANVHGLYSNKKKDGDDSDDEKDESNNRYVGGIGDHGGGRSVSVCACVLNMCWDWLLLESFHGSSMDPSLFTPVWKCWLCCSVHCFKFSTKLERGQTNKKLFHMREYKTSYCMAANGSERWIRSIL